MTPLFNIPNKMNNPQHNLMQDWLTTNEHLYAVLLKHNLGDTWAFHTRKVWDRRPELYTKEDAELMMGRLLSADDTYTEGKVVQLCRTVVDDNIIVKEVIKHHIKRK